MITMLENLEYVLACAKSNTIALRSKDAAPSDMILIELAIINLDNAVASLRAAFSTEGADIEAPEEPAASTH